MKFDKEYFNIGSHFICALAYGDYSGLTDDEIQDLECFISELPKSGNSHWDFGDYEELDKCYVSGMLSNCTECVYLYTAN
jgi:hypothetical protein